VKQNHIIQKVFIEITVNNKEKAFSIKEDINSFLAMDVFPEIEKYINALDYKLDNHILQIPRLALNLDVKNSSLDAELKEKITQLFKEEIEEITKSIDTSEETEHDSKAYLIDHQKKLVQTFIYFLEKGHTPWWNSDEKHIAFLEPKVFDTLIMVNDLQESIIPILSKPNVQDRIIHQLSNEQIAQLCLVILKNKELKINLGDSITHPISKLSHNERIIMWRLILNVLSKYVSSSNSNIREYLLQQIANAESASAVFSKAKKNHQNVKTIVEIFPFINKDEIIEIIKKNSENASKNEEILIVTTSQKDTEAKLNMRDEDLIKNEGQYVQNAGLILIHPFIKIFFEHCQLLHPKTQQLIDPELCAHLLHYIATGKTNAPEYEMTFEKFLCNIPMNKTINKHIKLSSKHKTQAKNVIESVQYNWAPMKKSSVALLQNEFFQRSGKLIITDHDYTLTVERKTQDILLEKLDWGIGLVKLPWQEKFIFVNW